MLYNHSKVISRVNTTHLAHYLKKTDRNWLTSISYLRRVIDILKQLDSTENGQRAEVSSTMTRRHSSCGSMKRTNSELSVCKRDAILVLFLRDLQEHAATLKRQLSLPMMSISVTLHLAQLTWVPHLEPQFTSDFQNYHKEWMSSNLLLTSITCRLEEFTENIQKLLIVYMTFQIRED